jgi:aminopeptidase N
MKLALIVAAVLALAGPALAAPAPSPARVVLPAAVEPERYDVKVTPDAEKLTFQGQATITLNVKTATRTIVLNAADLTFGKVALSGRAEAPRVTLDADLQTATFTFTAPVAPGRYQLAIDYVGKIYQQASGLFALDYDTPQGKRRALFTQFENSDERRFVPSWDEPGRKAVFALTVVAPAGQMAVSNMPVAKTETLDGGLQAVRFQDSPKMSSYLVFLALGDFERISQKVGDTEVGVITRRGETAKGQFALDAAVKLLSYYNGYFGTPYPLPKLDLIAGPGQSQFFGAMENWGAIFYFDYYLLLDPKLSTEADKQQVFIVVAHEMAHQWFGDLVTMAWWDDLWLNEGFASWMENKATDHFHPEWKVWLQTQEGQQSAMRLDARAGTHPIITNIPDVFAAANAFDDITYQKGQAVIRMLEAYAGEDAFRAGVQAYIRKHAYGNTVSDDLWAELDKTSPRPVSDIAHDFTLQPGVPLIRARQTSQGVALTQSRFAADAASAKPLTWRTPVVVAPAAGQGEWRGVVSAKAPAAVTGPAAQVPILNAGQTGYFRSAYDPALWAPLAARFASLTPADQLGLLYDSRALGETGQAPMGAFLDLAARAPAQAEPAVLQTLTGQLAAIDYLYEGRPGQAAFRAFARGRLNPVLGRLGWDAKPGEADGEVLLRAAVLQGLGELDDPAVVAKARGRFAAFVADPASLAGSTRKTVLNIVAGQADAATWDQLHAMAKAASDPTDKSRLYSLLGASHDPALADKALALALGGEPPVTVAPAIIRSVAGVFPERAFDFIMAHRTEVEAMIEPTSRSSFFASIPAGARDAATAQKLTAYAKAHMPASSRGEADKANAAIAYRAKVIAERLPEIDRWLAAHGG